MNALKTLQVLSVCLALATSLPQTGLAQPKEERGNQRESRMLMHLLKMDDAGLQELRQTVERIEAMSPEERANMRERLSKLQSMKPERREAMRQRFEAIPDEKREEMRQRWFELSPEARREWRNKFRDMNPEERADAMEEAGLMPPRPKHKMHDGEGPPDGHRGPPPPDGHRGPPDARRGPPPLGE